MAACCLAGRISAISSPASAEIVTGHVDTWAWPTRLLSHESIAKTTASATSTAFHSTLIMCVFLCVIPDTHRRRWRDSTVELSCVSVGSRDPVYNFPCRWAVEVGDNWWPNDVIGKKVINIVFKIRVVKPLWSLVSFQIVDRIRRQSSWVSCELCSHRRRRATQLDSWVACNKRFCDLWNCVCYNLLTHYEI